MLLVAECRVEAGRRDAHGCGEVVDGGGFVAVAPEEEHRLVEGGFAIETQGAAGLARFHRINGFRWDRRVS